MGEKLAKSGDMAAECCGREGGIIPDYHLRLNLESFLP